jgi:hypothetical protein
MKTFKIALTSALLVLAVSHSAHAADPVFFKSPINFNGTGCDPGSIVVSGENTASMSILFGRYDAGKNAISGLARSACNFAVPVHVPQGWQLSVMTADWQGFAQGQGRFTRSYGTSQNPNAIPQQVKALNSPSGANWQAKDGLMHSTAVSGCGGGDFNLRINSSVQAIGSNSYVAVDTVDMNNRVVFHLNWMPCH